MMQVQERLSPALAQSVIQELPRRIQDALTEHAIETGDPIEAVLEMAIISFLDLDAISFEDCRTDAPGRLRERVAILEAVIERQGIDLPGVLS